MLLHLSRSPVSSILSHPLPQKARHHTKMFFRAAPGFISFQKASEKILFISEGKSLIIHALQRNLTKNGYELIPCPLDVEALHAHERDAELILMYLNGEEDSKTDALVYLKALHGKEQAADPPRKSSGHQVGRGIHPRARHFGRLRAPCRHECAPRTARVSDRHECDAGPAEAHPHRR